MSQEVDLLLDIKKYTSLPVTNIKYINNNLYDRSFYHTIATDTHFITSKKYLMESIQKAEGSIFNEDTYATRLAIIKRYSTDIPHTICDEKLALYETLPNEFANLSQIITDVATYVNLTLVQNDDVIIFEKPNYTELTLEDFKTDSTLWDKYDIFANQDTVFNVNKDEINTLWLNTDNDSIFSLIDDIVFNSYTKYRMICDHEDHTKGTLQIFIINETDDTTFEDLKQLAKCDNYLSTLAIGSSNLVEDKVYERL